MIIFLQILPILGVLKIMMDLATVQQKLTDLKTSIDSLLALPVNPAPVDLQPLGDAVDAIQAEVTAKLTPPAG